MNLKMLLEKRVSNPLRKQKIKDEGGVLPPTPENRRTKIDGTYRKIYEFMGIQVFLDRSITPDIDFKPNSFNVRMVKLAVGAIIRELMGILPHKKAKIVISNSELNPEFTENLKVAKAAGFYSDRIIYIDYHSLDDPSIWKHEYAHYVADLIPSQTEPMLEKAYKELLDLYYVPAKKKKRVNLEPEDPDFVVSVMQAERMRKNISKKLGFPEYGLMNFHEFFAVLIENWGSLPNNRATYKFKSLVKQVLLRL